MEISAEKKRKIRNGITVISLLLLVVVAVVLFLSVRKGTMHQGVFMGVLIGFLVLYWVLLDVVEPKLLHELDNLTPEKRLAYIKYAGLDALGFAGLAVFVFNIGENSSMGMVGAVAYVLTINLKKKAKDEFYNMGNVDGDASEDSDSVAEEEIPEELVLTAEEISGESDLSPEETAEELSEEATLSDEENS